MINTKSIGQQPRPKRDLMLWALVLILVVGGIGANYYFAEVAWALRAAVGLVLILAVIGIAIQTDKGQEILGFAKQARKELRKVVWPTRQETIQTTMFVGVMVIVMALILWGVDSTLMWVVGWFTGQRG